MKTKKLRKKIKESIKSNKNVSDEQFEGKYQPRKFGESKSVSFEISGLAKSFCQATEWTNGEGFDFSFECDGIQKGIRLHLDDISVMLACLNHFKMFDSE